MTHTQCTLMLCLGLLTAGATCHEPPAPAPAPVPLDPMAGPEQNLGGEGAHDTYPEHDARRGDQYDPATETDSYMHRESNDDAMMEHQCMEQGCPEHP